MSDEERRMLREMHAQMAELRRELFCVPAGSDADARPLIEEVRIVVRAYHRASWATRLVMWLLPIVAGLGVALKEISRWFGPKAP